MEKYNNVHNLDHPLIRHKLAIIRNKNTDTAEAINLLNRSLRVKYIFPRKTTAMKLLQIAFSAVG